MLQKEFGVEPEHDTQELYEAIQNQKDFTPFAFNEKASLILEGEGKKNLTPQPSLLEGEGEQNFTPGPGGRGEQ